MRAKTGRKAGRGGRRGAADALVQKLARSARPHGLYAWRTPDGTRVEFASLADGRTVAAWLEASRTLRVPGGEDCRDVGPFAALNEAARLERRRCAAAEEEGE